MDTLSIDNPQEIRLLALLYCFSFRIIWPGGGGALQSHVATTPLTAGTRSPSHSTGILRRCGAAFRKPLWCFPQTSVDRPTCGGEPIVWLPPIMGFAPAFWCLVIASAGLCLAAYLLPSAVGKEVMQFGDS